MLPPFNNTGDLPPGIHVASWSEVEYQFGIGSSARTRNLAKLRHLYELASRTEKLTRFLLFGSFVAATDSPRDVDVVLIMAPDFKLEEAPRECQTLFSRPRCGGPVRSERVLGTGRHVARGLDAGVSRHVAN